MGALVACAGIIEPIGAVETSSLFPLVSALFNTSKCGLPKCERLSVRLLHFIIRNSTGTTLDKVCHILSSDESSAPFVKDIQLSFKNTSAENSLLLFFLHWVGLEWKHHFSLEPTRESKCQGYLIKSRISELVHIIRLLTKKVQWGQSFTDVFRQSVSNVSVQMQQSPKSPLESAVSVPVFVGCLLVSGGLDDFIRVGCHVELSAVADKKGKPRGIVLSMDPTKMLASVALFSEPIEYSTDYGVDQLRVVDEVKPLDSVLLKEVEDVKLLSNILVSLKTRVANFSKGENLWLLMKMQTLVTKYLLSVSPFVSPEALEPVRDALGKLQSQFEVLKTTSQPTKPANQIASIRPRLEIDWIDFMRDSPSGAQFDASTLANLSVAFVQNTISINSGVTPYESEAVFLEKAFVQNVEVTSTDSKACIVKALNQKSAFAGHALFCLPINSTENVQFHVKLQYLPKTAFLQIGFVNSPHFKRPFSVSPDGFAFACDGLDVNFRGRRPYGEPFSNQDSIVCEFNQENNCVGFKQNENNLGVMYKVKEKNELWFVVSVIGGDAILRITQRDYEPFLTLEQMESAPVIPDLTQEQLSILSDLDVASGMNCEAFFEAVVQPQLEASQVVQRLMSTKYRPSIAAPPPAKDTSDDSMPAFAIAPTQTEKMNTDGQNKSDDEDTGSFVGDDECIIIDEGSESQELDSLGEGDEDFLGEEENEEEDESWKTESDESDGDDEEEEEITGDDEEEELVEKKKHSAKQTTTADEDTSTQGTATVGGDQDKEESQTASGNAEPESAQELQTPESKSTNEPPYTPATEPESKTKDAPVENTDPFERLVSSYTRSVGESNPSQQNRTQRRRRYSLSSSSDSDGSNEHSEGGDDSDNESTSDVKNISRLSNQPKFNPQVGQWASLRIEKSENTENFPLTRGVIESIEDDVATVAFVEDSLYPIKIRAKYQVSDLEHPHDYIIQKTKTSMESKSPNVPAFYADLGIPVQAKNFRPEDYSQLLLLELSTASDCFDELRLVVESRKQESSLIDACTELREIYNKTNTASASYEYFRKSPSSGIMNDPITSTPLGYESHETLIGKAIRKYASESVEFPTFGRIFKTTNTQHLDLMRRFCEHASKLDFSSLILLSDVMRMSAWQIVALELSCWWKSHKEATAIANKNALKEEISHHLIHPQSQSKVHYTQLFGAHEVQEVMSPLPSRGTTQRTVKVPGASALVLSFGEKSYVSTIQDAVAITSSILGYQQICLDSSNVFKPADGSVPQIIVNSDRFHYKITSNSDRSNRGIQLSIRPFGFEPQSIPAIHSPLYAAWLLENIVRYSPETVDASFFSFVAPLIVTHLEGEMPEDFTSVKWRLMRLFSSVAILAYPTKPSLSLSEAHIKILKSLLEQLFFFREKASNIKCSNTRFMRPTLEFFFWIARIMNDQFSLLFNLKKQKKDQKSSQKQKKRRGAQSRNARRRRRREDSSEEDEHDSGDDSLSESDNSDTDDEDGADSKRGLDAEGASKQQNSILNEMSLYNMFKDIFDRMDDKMIDILHILSDLGTATDLLLSMLGQQTGINEVIDDAWVHSQQKYSVHESGHPFGRKVYSGAISFPGAKGIQLIFNSKCSLPNNASLRIVTKRAGSSGDDVRSFDSNFGQNVTNLTFNSSELSFTTEEKIVHSTVTCDGCRRHPLQTVRYKCIHCSDFDFCERCEGTQQHNPNHVFLKVHRVTDNSLPRNERSLNLLLDSTVHEGISCGRCGVSPIEGVRYACSNCDFNLCTQCEKLDDSHDPLHIFLKLKHPVEPTQLATNRLWRFGPFYNESSMWGFSFTAIAIPSDEENEKLKLMSKSMRSENIASMSNWTSQMDQKLVSCISKFCQEKAISVSRFSHSLCKSAIAQNSAIQSIPGAEMRAILSLILNQRWHNSIEHVDNEVDLTLPSLYATLVKSKHLLFTDLKEEYINKVLDAKKTSQDVVQVRLKRFAPSQNSKEPRRTVFEQIMTQFRGVNPRKLWHEEHAFSVKLLGEGAEDAGGPYREAFYTLSNDMMSPALMIFVPCANNRSNHGKNRDKFVPNPNCNAFWVYEFIGKMMGVAIRTHDPLEIDLAPIVWKGIVNEKITIDDVFDVDAHFEQTLEMLHNPESVGLDESTFESTALAFTTFVNGSEVDLIPNGSNIAVTWENRLEYARLLQEYHIREFVPAIQAIRHGLADVVPISELALFTAEEIEDRVCGRKEVDIPRLKQHTTYSDCNASDAHIQFFWSVLEEFTQQQRAMFIKFVCGRSRMPRSEEHSKDFQINSFSASENVDNYLPVAHTCFFSVDLPAYTSLNVMRTKLLMAIENCHEIDADFTPTDA